MIGTIVKEITFESAHRLPGVGKCDNLHGHSYKLQVEVTGPIISGMVMNFSDLKRILGVVHDQFDHKYTNDLMDFPSAENMVVFMWSLIKILLPVTVELTCLRLWEQADSFVEYRGGLIDVSK